MSITAADANRWWDSLDEERRCQIYSWIARPDHPSQPIPGQLALLMKEERHA